MIAVLLLGVAIGFWVLPLVFVGAILLIGVAEGRNVGSKVTTAVSSLACPHFGVVGTPGPLAKLGILAAHDAAVAVVHSSTNVVTKGVFFGVNRFHDAIAAAFTAISIPDIIA